MASPTQWTWVCINSGSWWWTGRPGMLLFMGLQRVRHDWATELNWTEPVKSWGLGKTRDSVVFPMEPIGKRTNTDTSRNTKLNRKKTLTAQEQNGLRCCWITQHFLLLFSYLCSFPRWVYFMVLITINMLITSLQITNAGEGVEKREPSYTVGWNISWYSHYGKQYEDSSKTKSRIATWSSNPTPAHICGQNCNSKRSMHRYVHSTTIYNSQDMEAA